MIGVSGDTVLFFTPNLLSKPLGGRNSLQEVYDGKDPLVGEKMSLVYGGVE